MTDEMMVRFGMIKAAQELQNRRSSASFMAGDGEGNYTSLERAGFRAEARAYDDALKILRPLMDTIQAVAKV